MLNLGLSEPLLKEVDVRVAGTVILTLRKIGQYVEYN